MRKAVIVLIVLSVIVIIGSNLLIESQPEPVPPPQRDDTTLRRTTGGEVVGFRDKHGARTWQGRLVSEEHVTHILIVADSPAQDLQVNRRLEAALRAMDLGFTLTAPMPVEEEPLA